VPVFRFRSHADARRALWKRSGDAALPGAIRWALGLTKLLEGWKGLPRGVRKFRSIQEAHADRRAWEKKAALELRARREHARASAPTGCNTP